jgi:hypothetical protein
MNSLDPECNDLKQKYDACFNLWFSEKFLRGSDKSEPPSMCQPLFVLYQKCVRVSGCAIEGANANVDVILISSLPF